MGLSLWVVDREFGTFSGYLSWGCRDGFLVLVQDRNFFDVVGHRVRVDLNDVTNRHAGYWHRSTVKQTEGSGTVCGLILRLALLLRLLRY